MTSDRCQGNPDGVVTGAEIEACCRRLVDGREPLAALQATRDLRDMLLDWESQLARSALASGETWETIGAALGVSRQSAWERLRPGIARDIEADRRQLREERARLAAERSKTWPRKR